MNVSPTQRIASGASSVPTTSSTNSISSDSFLKLLMAQLKNQDPTQPMDPSQMVTQLATVSQVTEAQKMNSTLAQLLSTSTVSQATQLIGHTLTSGDGLTKGKVVSVTVGSAGLVATLDNGAMLSLDGEYKISA